MLSPMLGNHENVTLLWLDDNADTQRTLLAVRPLHATRAEAIRAIC